MVDKVRIDRIQNGFIVGCSWWGLDSTKDVYYKDMSGIIKHLNDCFGAVDKELEKAEAKK